MASDDKTRIKLAIGEVEHEAFARAKGSRVEIYAINKDGSEGALICTAEVGQTIRPGDTVTIDFAQISL